MFQLHSYNETWELSKMHSYRKREIVLEQCFGSQCFPTLTNRSCVQPGSHFIVTEMCSIISLIPIIDSYSVSTFWQQSSHWKIHQTATGCLKKATTSKTNIKLQSISQAWFLFALKSSVSAFHIDSMASFTPNTE